MMKKNGFNLTNTKRKKKRNYIVRQVFYMSLVKNNFQNYNTLESGHVGIISISE